MKQSIYQGDQSELQCEYRLLDSYVEQVGFPIIIFFHAWRCGLTHCQLKKKNKGTIASVFWGPLSPSGTTAFDSVVVVPNNARRLLENSCGVLAADGAHMTSKYRGVLLAVR